MQVWGCLDWTPGSLEKEPFLTLICAAPTAQEQQEQLGMAGVWGLWAAHIEKKPGIFAEFGPKEKNL